MSDQKVSIVTRLGGDGFPQIYELQICLAAQKDRNFIWLVLLRPSAQRFEKELRSQLMLNKELWKRTKLIKCNTDNRSKLLNIALKNTTTGYLSVFDDDDLPLSNYVETIRNGAKKVSSSSIIRMQTVQVETKRSIVDDSSYDFSTSKCKYLWPESFDRLEHLRMNNTPCMALSFPVKLLKKYELVWDETLSAVEDWDFLMRSSEVIPVQSTKDVTSIYRRADNQYRSKKQLNARDWHESEKAVRAKINNQMFLLLGSQIISFQRGPGHTSFTRTPLRAKILVRLTHNLQPRLTKTPQIYLLGKKTYKILVKMLKVDRYV